MISIVICSITPSRLEAVGKHFAELLSGTPHELIGITDAKSMGEGYNRGLAQARGEVVIFCHDDIEIISPDFRDRLLHYLDHYDIIGIAGTDKLECGVWTQAGIPHVFGQVVYPRPDGQFEVVQYGVPARVIDQIQAMDGVFLAARRDVARAVGFDEMTFTGFHFYDIDFTFRAHQRGFRLAVCNDINLIHASRGLVGQAYHDELAVFDEKYRGRLRPRPPLKFDPASIATQDRAELIDLMRWRCWADTPPPARFNPIDHPILFHPPWFVSGLSDLVQHAPLAHLVVQLTRPRTIVEIGTSSGDLYMALCWASKHLNTESRCFGVNTGAGGELLDSLRSTHDPAFGNFSTLVRDAEPSFDDGSIDLLHLDTPTEAMLDRWLPKLSRRGVLMLHHPAAIPQRWQAMAPRYPGFEFLHGRVMGMLAIGPEPTPALIELLRELNHSPGNSRAVFSALGRRADAIGKLLNVSRGLYQLRGLLAQLQKQPAPTPSNLFEDINRHEALLAEIAQQIIALANSGSR